MVYHYVFDELADLLASMDPDKVLAFRTSEKAQLRLDELLEKISNQKDSLNQKSQRWSNLCY